MCKIWQLWRSHDLEKVCDVEHVIDITGFIEIYSLCVIQQFGYIMGISYIFKTSDSQKFMCSVLLQKQQPNHGQEHLALGQVHRHFPLL